MGTLEGPRRARKEELPAVLELVDSVFNASLGRPPTARRSFPLLFNDKNLDNLRIVVDQGRPVAHLGIVKVPVVMLGCRLVAALVGLVCTHPDYRNRGLATALLSDAIRKLREDHVDFMLVSGRGGIYRRMDCAVTGRVVYLEIPRTVAARWDDRKVSLVSATEREVEAFAAIHQREPVRFRRSLEEFRQLLAVRDLASICVRHHFLVVSDGVPVSYLVFEREKMAPWFLGPRIGEYAGARWGVVAGIARIFAKENLKRLLVPVPGWDEGLLRLMVSLGVSLPATGAFEGTIRIIDLVHLMNCLRPCLRERIDERLIEKLEFSQDEGSFSIKVGPDRLGIPDVSALTRLVFGETRESTETQVGGSRGARRVLNALFPLPTLLYGLNYT